MGLAKERIEKMKKVEKVKHYKKLYNPVSMYYVSKIVCVFLAALCISTIIA